MKTTSLHFCRRFALVLLAALTSLTGFRAEANVRLPHVLASDMVLQRDLPIQVWGWADPGEKVTCELGQGKATATANAEGQWIVKLPAMSAGGPFEMTVSGNNTLKLTGILVGEVWLCSGQSNMEMGIGMCKDGKAEIAAADHPNIRLFLVPKKASGKPLTDVEAAWRPCTPQTVAAGGWGGFSAAAYYFGREVQKSLNVPIGLIASSWGGTRIEPWTPPVGFGAVSSLKSIGDKIQQADADHRKAVGTGLDQIEAAVGNARKALDAGKPLPAIPPLSVAKHRLESEREPTGLYNGMIHPLAPFGIRGAIWYQGESNNGENMVYLEKMKALIGGWRKVWNQGEFPFLFVQLAPYKYGGAPTQLPGIWNAQLASLSIPNTGMAVTTDITMLNDIHPTNKQDVGKRLALWALANTYGKKEIVFSGPLYKSLKIDGGKIAVSFDHIGTGLVTRDGKEVTLFEIAGADGKFVPAQAVIDGGKIIVSAEAVPSPTKVRFAWDQLAQPNLMNKEQLPASPFSSAELAR